MLHTVQRSLQAKTKIGVPPPAAKRRFPRSLPVTEGRKIVNQNSFLTCTHHALLIISACHIYVSDL